MDASSSRRKHAKVRLTSTEMYLKPVKVSVFALSDDFVFSSWPFDVCGSSIIPCTQGSVEDLYWVGDIVQ